MGWRNDTEETWTEDGCQWMEIRRDQYHLMILGKHPLERRKVVLTNNSYEDQKRASLIAEIDKHCPEASGLLQLWLLS